MTETPSISNEITVSPTIDEYECRVQILFPDDIYIWPDYNREGSPKVKIETGSLIDVDMDSVISYNELLWYPVRTPGPESVEGWMALGIIPDEITTLENNPKDSFVSNCLEK